MTNQEEKEKVVNNIYALQDMLADFLYATDYFGLSHENESNEALKRIFYLAHKLYDEINLSDLINN